MAQKSELSLCYLSCSPLPVSPTQLFCLLYQVPVRLQTSSISFVPYTHLCWLVFVST